MTRSNWLERPRWLGLMTQVDEDTIPYQPKRGEEETTILASGFTTERVEAAEERHVHRRQQQLRQSQGYSAKTAKYGIAEQHD